MIMKSALPAFANSVQSCYSHYDDEDEIARRFQENGESVGLLLVTFGFGDVIYVEVSGCAWKD